MAYFNFNPKTDDEKLRVLVHSDNPPKSVKLLEEWKESAESPILKKYLSEWIEQCKGGAVVSSDTFHEAFAEVSKSDGVPAYAGGGTIGSVKEWWSGLDLNTLPENVQTFIREQLMDPPADFSMDNATFVEVRELIEQIQKTAAIQQPSVNTDMLPTDKETGTDTVPERTTFVTAPKLDELSEEEEDKALLNEAIRLAKLAQEQYQAPVFIFKHEPDGTYFFAKDKDAGTHLIQEIPYEGEDGISALQEEIERLTPALEFLSGKDKKEVKDKIKTIKEAIELLGGSDKKAQGGTVAAKSQHDIDLMSLSMLFHYAVKLFSMVTDKLPAWAVAKISKTEFVVSAVKHALQAKHADLFKAGGELTTGQHTKLQLKHIAEYSEKMLVALKEVKLEPWMSSNLFMVADYMDSIYHFLDYQKNPKLARGGRAGKVHIPAVVAKYGKENEKEYIGLFKELSELRQGMDISYDMAINDGGKSLEKTENKILEISERLSEIYKNAIEKGVEAISIPADNEDAKAICEKMKVAVKNYASHKEDSKYVFQLNDLAKELETKHGIKVFEDGGELFAGGGKMSPAKHHKNSGGKEEKFIIYNATDGITAWPTPMTKEKADEWIANTRKAFKEGQGYYFTSNMQRIDPDDIKYLIVPQKNFYEELSKILSNQ